MNSRDQSTDRTLCGQCGTQLDEAGDLPPEKRKPCAECGSTSRRSMRMIGEWDPKPLAFLSLPWTDDFKSVREHVAKALREAGIQIAGSSTEADEGRSVPDLLLRQLEAADIVVVDLTHRSPNVLYELGYANALRKPVLSIVRASGSAVIPWAAQGSLYYPYDIGKLDELSKIVRSWATRRAHARPPDELTAQAR